MPSILNRSRPLFMSLIVLAGVCRTPGAMAGDDGGIAAVPTGSAFSFQGKLDQGGQNFTGQAQFGFSLYDAPTGGVFLGNSVPSSPILAVTTGLFNAQIDFGTPAFVSQSARWMEISVRVPPNTGSWVTLSPRQRISPAPVAIYALNGAGLTLPFNGIGAVANPLFYITNNDTGGIGVRGDAPLFGVQGRSASIAGAGVSGQNLASGNTAYLGGYSHAIYGISSGFNSGHGVYGENSAVYAGAGVSGRHVLSGNFGELGHPLFGVYGFGVTGVRGQGDGTSATSYGVEGINTGCVGRLGSYTPGKFANAVGVYGSGGPAGLFDGSVYVNGRLIVEYDAVGSALNINNNAGGATGLYSAVPTGKAIHAVNAISGHAGYFEGFTFFSNNIGLNVVTPTFPIHHSSGARLTAGGVWTNACDANLKQDFQSVDAADVLQRIADMPIQTWSYKAEADVKHIGPTAQDFRAAFGLGADGVSIGTVDADGVALAAIQALNQQLKNKEARVALLEADMLLMRQQLDEMRTQNRTSLAP